MTVASAPATGPTDPRADWQLPPFGQMPRVERLDELTTRVLAPNPSPMTLDGTNTYLLSTPGSGAAVIVDPGPVDASHLAAVEQSLSDMDAGCALIVATHHHVDHVEAAGMWAERFGCDVKASAPAIATTAAHTIGDGDLISLSGLSLRIVATPGHTADHLAVELETGALLTGDHILGRGTSVVAHPDGDLLAYLDSVRCVLDLGQRALFPGHGPHMTVDSEAVLNYYLDHRAFREAQLLAALQPGPATPGDLVATIYAGVPTHLWPAAELSLRAGIEKLRVEGQLEFDGVAVRRSSAL